VGELLRSGKILLLSHCLLNANSKIKGAALHGPVLKPVVRHILQQETGIMQLPCPEHSFAGGARWGQSKDQYDNPFYRRHCSIILGPVIDQLMDYHQQGYKLIGVLGIKGSPSCGIHYTYRAKWGGEIIPHSGDNCLPSGSLVKEPGVFLEIFQEKLAEAGLKIPFFEVAEDDLEGTLKSLKEFMSRFA
jgi:predicted secreted protein